MGTLFPDGGGIELLRDAATGRLQLLFFEGKKRIVAPRIETRASVYLPAELEPSILRAITLPSKCTNFGSTLELFASVRELFVAQGFSEEVAQSATYFSFSSWFVDCLPSVPCLVITGPRPEADFLLRLFACTVRHPLRLRDLTRANLFSLPWELQPTLLLDHIPDSRSARSLIFCSNNRGSYVESKGNLIDVCCSKAVYLGTVLAESDPDYLSLRVSLVPFRGRLPVLAQSTQRQIADEIQSKMLAYRVQNYADVTQSKFDLPQYCSETRMLAHALGACVVDAPEVQAGIESLLHDGEESARSARWCDPRCVTLESFLVHCHAEQAERIPIGMIARYANGILRGRGETTALGPKEAGGILRSLGVVPKRNSKGYAIKLTAGVRRRAHELARDFDVAAVQERLSQCPLCVELFPSGDGDLLDQASPSQGEARGADSA